MCARLVTLFASESMLRGSLADRSATLWEAKMPGPGVERRDAAGRGHDASGKSYRRSLELLNFEKELFFFAHECELVDVRARKRVFL